MALFILLQLWLLISHTDSKNPNIFFILADDFGWADVNWHRTQKDSEVVTPNMDNLAQTGLEMMRHYVYFVCSPTRSSFQSGRLPVHVEIQNEAATSNNYQGVTINMTFISNRMKQAGYSTAMVGKWDVGMAAIEQAPKARGYDESLIYFHHANEFYLQTTGPKCNGSAIVDLWDTDKPAVTLNGTNYEETIFAERIYDLIDNKFSKLPADTPFFMVYTPHVGHAPLQVPKQYLSTFENDEYECGVGVTGIYPGWNGTNTDKHCRSIYHSMVNYLDLVIGNITDKLKKNNLWDNTLLVFTVDNGGCEHLSENAGNNNPLRGGKYVPFEGGVRGTTFVNGGYLPANRKGKVENGMMHIADWYVTFCSIVGIDCNDTKAMADGLPNVDGMNMWPLISGANKTSPRTEYAINGKAFIQNQYKLLFGNLQYASWGGPQFPNTSSMANPIENVTLECGQKGCLFDVVADWTEHVDIADQNQDIVQKMTARLNELKKGFWQNSNNHTGKNSCPANVANNECPCYMAQNQYGGFWGPWQNLPSD